MLSQAFVNLLRRARLHRHRNDLITTLDEWQSGQVILIHERILDS